MYRSVLTDKAFVPWANEHLVILVAHNELGHDEESVENATGGEQKRCPLYPGMTCRDHLNAAVDVENDRDEDLVPVPFLELCPNTWLVRPDRKVVRVAEKDQFQGPAIKKQVEDVQKELGPSLGHARYVEIRDLLQRGDRAYDESSWHQALRDWAATARIEDEPHASLRALVEARVEMLDEAVELEIDDWVEETEPTAQALEAGRALFEALDVRVFGRHVASRKRLGLWLDAYGGG